MAILNTGQRVGNYFVQSLIKENLYTETYRVEDEDHNPYFLKTYLTKKMPEKMINQETGIVYEIERSQNLKHKNLISFIESGSMSHEEGNIQYYLTNYLTGEVLADKIHREGVLSEEMAIDIYKSILEGLQYLHERGIFHNDITPRNIMLSRNEGIEPQIIDLGHISERCNGKVSFDVSDLEMLYSANETFAGMYDEQSDIFSATAVLYAMLKGEAPWNTQMPESANRGRKSILLKDYRKSNPINWNELAFSDRTKYVLSIGLAIDFNNRARNVASLLAALDPTKDAPAVKTDASESESPKGRANGSSQKSTGNSGEMGFDPNHVEFEIKRGGGNGFKDIAGMNDLKNYLNQKIIFVIKNKELAEKYRLTPPNAMLLYGPPGCGKTFIAEKFAEETNFNYILVKSSDLASSFVHGSQQKIAKLFNQAQSNAPIVVCFDEFDALVPDRSQTATQFVAGEVNEFLSQLNNCSQRGIFIVATSNRPDKIDPAVLRTGRIDKQVYVPLPDRDARAEMFKLHLNGRPYNENEISFDKLSDMTDGYIASDIAYIVNDAAMVAAFTGQDITEELMEQSIHNTHPSLRKDVLKQYETMRESMEGIERRNLTRTRRPIGFSAYER